MPYIFDHSTGRAVQGAADSAAAFLQGRRQEQRYQSQVQRAELEADRAFQLQTQRADQAQQGLDMRQQAFDAEMQQGQADGQLNAQMLREQLGIDHLEVDAPAVPNVSDPKPTPDDVARLQHMQGVADILARSSPEMAQRYMLQRSQQEATREQQQQQAQFIQGVQRGAALGYYGDPGDEATAARIDTVMQMAQAGDTARAHKELAAMQQEAAELEADQIQLEQAKGQVQQWSGFAQTDQERRGIALVQSGLNRGLIRPQDVNREIGKVLLGDEYRPEPESPVAYPTGSPMEVAATNGQMTAHRVTSQPNVAAGVREMQERATQASGEAAPVEQSAAPWTSIPSESRGPIIRDLETAALRNDRAEMQAIAQAAGVSLDTLPRMLKERLRKRVEQGQARFQR